MKKILFFINTLNNGGAEKVLVDLVNNLDSQKFQITVQTFWNTGVYQTALKDHITYKTVIRTRHPILRRIVSKVLMRLLPAKCLYNWFVKDDYDCEIAFLEGFPTNVIANSTNTAARKIAWLHTDLLQYPDSARAYRKWFSEKDAYESMDKVVCVSESVRNSLHRKYKISREKTDVLYNAVDDEDIRQKSQQSCQVEFAHPLVISVGRLTEQKAFDRLLRVHKRLMDDGVKHTLWIVGEGEKRPELEAYIQKNDLSEVHLLGFQKNPYSFMAKADLFVSSSIAEGFSTVITESVVLGVPVISTNTAGAYEPAEAPRCSIVVDTEEELYRAVKKMLTDTAELERITEDVRKKRGFFTKKSFLDKISDFLLM